MRQLLLTDSEPSEQPKPYRLLRVASLATGLPRIAAVIHRFIATVGLLRPLTALLAPAGFSMATLLMLLAFRLLVLVVLLHGSSLVVAVRHNFLLTVVMTVKARSD
jgi:hypothetical protein